LTVLIKQALTVGPRHELTRVNILVEDELITQVSPDPPPPGSKSDVVIDGARRLAVPGLINAHVHTEETLWMNMVPDNVAHVPWFRQYTLPYYKELSDDDSYYSSLLADVLMLLCGVTCYADSANLWPDSDAQAAAKSGIRAYIGKWTCDLAEQFSDTTDGCLKSLERHLAKYSGPGLVRPIVSLIGSNTCSDELYVGAAKLAASRGTPITTHEASGHEDVMQSVTRTGHRPIEHLDRIGFLSQNTLISHATDLSDREVDLLGKHGSGVVLCPATELKKGKGLTHYGRLVSLISRGVKYCVATDNANSSNTLNPLRAASLLILLVKDLGLDPARLTAQDALKAVTSYPSRMLGLAAGAIHEGLLGDIALFDTHDPYLCLGHPIQGLIYGDQAAAAEVVVNGRLVVSGGEVTGIKLEDVVREAYARSQRIARRLGVENGFS
jgi:5-methylthioadenosine/S-adenosylhomocysteine deaminase